MIDPLVKRLRTSLSMLAQEEAANRIEELEAKLAKIVAIVRSHDTGDMQREDMEVRRILQRVEAELTGGKDE